MVGVLKVIGDNTNEKLERQKQWFDAFLYIFNKHWNKVDNFRIDKFLMFLRYHISAVMVMMKNNDYKEDLVAWFNDMVTRTVADTTPENAVYNPGAQGVGLQITDVFVVELGKIDAKDISLETLAVLLKPFLTCMATSSSAILRERLKDRIFTPLLESNVTMPDSDDEESEEEPLYLLDQRKLQNKTR